MQVGEAVIYRSRKGREWMAVVTRVPSQGQNASIEIQIDGDPFPVKVKRAQVRTCTEVPEAVPSNDSGSSASKKKGKIHMAMTAEERRAEVRELRDTAKGLGIKGCDSMSKAELKTAIAEAKAATKPSKKAKLEPRPKVAKEQAEKVRPPSEKAKPKTKSKAKAKPAPAPAEEAPKEKAKAKATKASKTAKATKKAASPAPKVVSKKAKAPTPPSNGDGPPNPFREGTDRAFIFGLLLKGGTRRQLAEKAMKRLDIRTYADDKPEPGIRDYDKRVMLTAAVLRDDYKYVFTKDGRGLEATIKVEPPAPKVKKAKAKAA